MSLNWILVLSSPFTWLLVFAAGVALFRRPERAAKQGTRRRRRGLHMASAAAGAAFQVFAIAYRPSHAFLVNAQITQQEKADEDDDGAPETPLKHLHRQLRRIRRGEPVGRLIWKL
jgi:hypothetical protein